MPHILWLTKVAPAAGRRSRRQSGSPLPRPGAYPAIDGALSPDAVALGDGEEFRGVSAGGVHHPVAWKTAQPFPLPTQAPPPVSTWTSCALSTLRPALAASVAWKTAIAFSTDHRQRTPWASVWKSFVYGAIPPNTPSPPRNPHPNLPDTSPPVPPDESSNRASPSPPERGHA